MDRKKFVQEQKERSKKRKEDAVIIQGIYEKYITSKDKSLCDKLLTAVDDYWRSYVKRKLYSKGADPNEAADDVFQNAHEGVLKILKKDMELGNIREEFAKYVFGIYFHKTYDAIREYIKKYKNEAFLIDDDERYSEEIPGESIDDILEYKERRKYAKWILDNYVYSIMETNVYPPKALALFYSRVITHLESKISDAKVSSPSWAFEHMKDRIVDDLVNEAQEYVWKKYSKDLKWSNEFLSQLPDQVVENGITYIVGKIVYTDVYDEKKIGHWSDHMHEKITIIVSEKLRNNSEIFDIANEYITNRHTKLNKLTGGKKR